MVNKVFDIEMPTYFNVLSKWFEATLMMSNQCHAFWEKNTEICLMDRRSVEKHRIKIDWSTICMLTK